MSSPSSPCVSWLVRGSLMVVHRGVILQEDADLAGHVRDGGGCAYDEEQYVEQMIEELLDSNFSMEISC